jgi:uncharacterized repeat protein (TIGR03837 family)
VWQENFQTDAVADVVIEAFACHLPDVYIAQMKQATTPPCWINLEYLSAETWVEGCHALNSIHPQTGLKKTFFFPGFTEKTGGLLREKNVITQRDKFLTSHKKNDFLTRLGITHPSIHAMLISLFSYENLAIASLLNTWRESPCPIICLVPAGKTLTAINAALNIYLVTGDDYSLGALRIKAIPFLTQTEYDQLLWACDINFVRGEDSFVRAQWAAKPFIWHIYPQDDAAHLIKLNAFLAKYTEPMTPVLAAAMKALWANWNAGEDCGSAWNLLYKQQQCWQEHSQNWCKNLSNAPDLAANLVHFCQKNL